MFLLIYTAGGNMSTNDSKIKNWSTTPAANGTAPNVSPFGYETGMKPSDLNPTNRQLMTDIRYQWDDAQWFSAGDVVSKASATSFKIATDVTARFEANRRIKIFSTNTLYASIASSSYSAPDTTINLLFDDTESTLGASLSAVALSIITATNSGIPAHMFINENLMIGGNFDTNPWQRGVTFATVATGTYTADRFSWIQSGAGVVTVKRTADAPTVAEAGLLGTYCLDVDVTTADGTIAVGDYYALNYKMEGYDFAQIAQRSFTVSFWVKSTKTGIFCFACRNSGTDRSYVAEYTINAADTWEHKIITVSASPSAGTWDYTNGIGLDMTWAIACGTTLGSGTLDTWDSNNMIATTNQVNGMDLDTNNFKVDFIKIEQGTQATAYEPELFSIVLEKCQRYYEKSYNLSDYPGTATTATGAISTINANSTTQILGLVGQFAVKKRTTPTIVWYSTSSATADRIRNVSAGTDPTVSSTSNNGMSTTGHPVVISTISDSDSLQAQWTASAEL